MHLTSQTHLQLRNMMRREYEETNSNAARIKIILMIKKILFVIKKIKRINSFGSENIFFVD